jgi:hypothetical protein
MTRGRSCCRLSHFERVALGGGKILLRLALLVGFWRFRSALRAARPIGGAALRMIGLAATGLGLILYASRHSAGLRGALGAQRLGSEAFEPDSFGVEIAAWASPRAVNGGRIVP